MSFLNPERGKAQTCFPKTLRGNPECFQWKVPIQESLPDVHLGRFAWTDILEFVWGCRDLRPEGLIWVRKCFEILLLRN